MKNKKSDDPKIEKLKARLAKALTERKLFSKALSETNQRFAEKIKEMSIIRRIGDSISSSLEKESVCKSIVDILISELTAENCSVMVLANDGKRLLIKAAMGQNDKKPRYLSDEENKNSKGIALGEGIAGWVAKTGKSILIKDIAKNKRFIKLEGGLKGINSLLCMPIMGKNGPVGVLNLSHPYIGNFSSENERFLTLILNAAALAFENIRLVEELEDINSRLEILVEERTVELKDSLEKYSNLIKQSSDGVALISFKNHTILECNKKLEQLTGNKQAFWVGKGIAELLDSNKNDLRSLISQLGDRRKKNDPLISTISKKGGKRGTPVSCSFSIIKLEKEPVICLTVRDITNQVLLEEKQRNYSQQLEEEVAKRTSELEKAQSELIQSAKMASLGQMATGVAHEINNPIAIIKGFAENLKEEILCGAEPTANEIGKCLGLIIENAERCSTIADAILNFSKPRNVVLSTIDIGESCEICSLLLKPRLKKDDLRLKISGNGLGSKIVTDKIQLEQVMINLLNNAIDAAPPKTQIDLKAKKIGKTIEVSVTDRGPGIARKNIHRVFDPFFTTKDPGKGTGLGLSISYRILKELGGEITVTSKPRKTIFKVKLPFKNAKGGI